MGVLRSEDTLLGRVGIANNLGEPMPNVNRRETILGLCISFLTLSWLCVGFRLYARFKIIYSPGWDDLFVVLSLLTTTMGVICIIVATNTGMGQHIVLLAPDVISNYLHIFYIMNATYCMSTALIKMSLLLQYLRLYRPGTALYNICRGLLVFIALWGIAYSIMAWVPCVPVPTYWTHLYNPTEEVKCYAYGSQLVSVFTATYESHAALNLVLDLLVMALPIPLYFQVDTPLKTKMGLVAIIVMGAFVNVFALWRFITMVQHKSTTSPTFDPTWYGPTPIVMAGLETASACICASVPVFWGPLIVSAASGLRQMIFVTKEVQVTSQTRFDIGGDRRRDSEVELHGATLSRENSSGGGGGKTPTPAAQTYTAQTWMGWAADYHNSDEGFHKPYESWMKD
ncbi:hypothetical protein B0H66DRAFT_180863 [Apodospora peruviana]|uniref:Rhodopsin domain-containing protein n=1 Tax=Apodospora peruviana TaxID=516989 RepID=A0AAE0IB52_9PEZI|nr:hypothetical protein B0H66DRAFT_180863 [Apodospora peruviana]